MNLLPAEWAPQSGVMLTWPHQQSDWAPWLNIVEPVFCDIAYHVTQHQSLLISCYDQAHQNHILDKLQQRGCSMAQINTYIITSNDSWCRDHGPITVLTNNAPQLLDFQFNGWGEKYSSTLDNTITTKLAEQGAFGNTTLKTVSLVLEGGSIESDGKGTLLTTSQCLLNEKRNPSLNQVEIEQQLKSELGIERFLWLQHGSLQGDDTDSHIDTLARFCNANTICYVSCDDQDDPHYQELRLMEQELKQFVDYQGQPYTLVPLPMAPAIYNTDGDRLPATYANFLIINNAVLAPVYGDTEKDQLAVDQLKICFPEREIIAIDCAPLVQQYGSLHCVTMQLPAGVLK